MDDGRLASNAKEPIIEPFEAGGLFTFVGTRGAHHVTPHERLVARLHDVGWAPSPAEQSGSAHTWVAELLRRYPAVTPDQCALIPHVWSALAATVGDPHDWDSVGAVLNMLQLFEEWE